MWEYKVVTSAGYLDEQDLNALGKEGWELVAVFENTFYFKRSWGREL
jgi:hypothetical protein